MGGSGVRTHTALGGPSPGCRAPRHPKMLEQSRRAKPYQVAKDTKKLTFNTSTKTFV